MFTDFIQMISGTSAAEQLRIFEDQKAATIEYIKAQDSIRMAVYNSSGMGHQACTASIIRSIARWGYTGTIRLFFYDTTLTYDAPLFKKMNLLFPQYWNPLKDFTVGGLTVSPRSLDRKFPVEAELGILGGYDRDQDFSYMLNVKNLVVLQPFRWTRGADAVEREGEDTVNLDELEGFYTQNRAFYMPVPTLTAEDEKILIANGKGNELEVVKAIVAAIVDPGFNVTAVYGVTTVMSATPELGMLNFISGILEAQSANVKNAKKGAIVVSLGTWGGSPMLEEPRWDRFQEWVYAGKASSGLIQPDVVFTAWHKDRDMAGRVFVLPDRNKIDKATIDNAIATLKTGQVLVVNVGSLPQILFNYLYASATLPTVMEGQSTTDTALNIGQPYLKLSGNEDRQVMAAYPTLPISATSPGTRAKTMNLLTYTSIQVTPDNWQNVRGELTNNPPKAGMTLIKEVKNPGPKPALEVYFHGLKLFFNNEVNDKLLLSLNYFVNVLGPVRLDGSTELAGLTVASAAMEALFDNLKRAVSDGVLNYYQAIQSGVLNSFFTALTSVLNITVETLEINSDKTRVELVGTTRDLPEVGKSQLSFSFTYENDNYKAALSASFPEATWALEGAQWLAFGNLGMKATLANGDSVPATGQITCSVTAGKRFDLSIQFPDQGGDLVVGGKFADGAFTLADIFQLAGGMDLSSQLPAPISAATKIGLKSFELGYDLKDNETSYFSINIGYDIGTTWPLLPGLVEIKDLAGNIVAYSPGDLATRRLEYSFIGSFLVDQSKVDINADLPNISVYGGLAPDSQPISIDQLVEYFLSVPSPINADIDQFAFNYQGDPYAYGISCHIKTNWPIPPAPAEPIFTVEGLGFEVKGTKNNTTGSFSGSIMILPNTEKIQLQAAAAYLGSNAGWTFEAQQTSGKISLLKLLFGYLPEGWQPDPSVRESFDVEIDGLGIKIETNTNSWEFTGKTATPISIPGTGIEVQLNLRMGYKGGPTTIGGRDALYADTYVPVLDETGDIVALSNLFDPPLNKIGYFGTVSAVVTWENIEITVFYDFNPDYKSFGITWGILEGKLTTTQGETTATLGFTKSTTIGSIAETMIGWATGSDFSLSSPWNILNSIPLNKLQLEYNFTKKQVGINVGIGPIEMGFARIDAITIQYKSNQPNPDDNGVQVELKGSFRWQQDPSQPLGWNAAKPETTPAPQGQGNKYLDLRLLALGQHVTLPCFADADTVQEAIACMKKLPVPDSNNIVIPPVTLDANSSWLIGMEFGILRFGPEKKPAAGGAEGTALIALEANEEAASGYLITMQIVFNDPHLYALRIKLDGDAAKVLKGLDFQIMYKKISDTIGMYKAEIALPDKMRFIRMGQCNITLPVFGIEYFTNGDFQVDIGFPWKADFARSLTFQTLIWTPVGIPIPVMGSLGVYFGKLSSATTNRVPKADNGTFNPVLVFGFGIQFGIGYEFDAGILKAGFSLTAVAILEGVVAKFNAYQITDGSGSTGLVESRQTDQVEASYYFALQGTVGIIGKLFGSIDFAIIKAEVNIDIRILASFTFAPYEPIVLNLTASVEVEVKVRINLGLFKITISFSFSAKISQSVTIKAIGSNPPWHVAQAQQALTSMSMFRRRPRRRVLPDLPMLNRKQAVLAPNWKNLETEQNKRQLTTYLTLSLTMAGDTASNVQEQLACYVAMMFIDSVLPPQEDRTSGSEKAYAAAPDTSFETLSKMVLRWAVAALQPQPVSTEQVDGIVVRELDLQALLDLLNDKKNPTPISAADVEYFLAGQFSVVAQGPTIDKQIDGTYFPVAPGMTLHVPKYGASEPLDYTFAAYNATSTEYVDFLRNYFDQLMVKVQEDERKNARNAFALADADGESLGSFVFNDYFLMLCKQMLQSALDSLREFKYYLVDGQTPDDIVRSINTNAGLTGADAYSLAELFMDNAGVPLSVGKGLVIEGSTYVVQTSDTFDSIAANPMFGSAKSGIGFSGAALAAFNADIDNTLSAGITINYPGKPAYLTQPGQSLATVAGELGILVSELIANGGITSLANLPLAVATLRLPPFTSTTVAGDTLRGVAAKFRIDTGVLAVNKTNGQVVNLFDNATTDALDIANLTQYKTGELIKEIQATQGLQHLSGMTSRYYMAGLRLPTNGITPKKKGMWVTGEPGNYHIPDLAGLYALTGQQFQIPELNNTDDFNVDFDNGGVPWLTFDNSDPTKLRISIKPGTDDRKQIDLVKGYATTQRLNTGLTFLGLRGMFNTKAATYSFNSEIDWNAASAFAMPYGGMPSGVPEMQLWLMPDSLLALPDLSKRKVNPRMAMKVGEHNEAARAMVDRPLNFYGYASVVEFTVKKVPVVEASPATKTTYEVVGADGSSAQVLERIVSEIGSDNSALQTLILAYPVDPNSTTSAGIQTDAENALTMGLAQVNLSTETRPDTAFSTAMLALRDGQGTTLLNQPTDFIRLLWEASITRAGGFYLYYFNSDSGGGLPDRVFNDKNEALLSLIVLYAKPGNISLQGTITSYMNALVTGVSIDRNTSQLFAEADPNNGVTISAIATQTLGSIAYEYFENVSQVAADNADLPLRNGLELTISEGTYEVGPSAPGGSLPAIAAWFGTTPQAILDANPKLPKPWPDPLPEYTALYLPEVKLVVTSDAKKNTLGGIAKYFGMNLTALASHNGELSGPFASGGSIRISGGPVITTSTVPAGNVTVEAVRSKPEEIPDKPAGNNYGEIFLQNMYSLLSYQVAGNVYFSSSKLGLPATPVAEPEDAKNVSKVRAPKAIAAGEDWVFRQAVPYNQFSLQTPTAVADLPDPNNSPYKGIGDLLQVDFAWQDLYGNRLFTDLSDPEAGDLTPLNLPPILTGYSDPIIGLTQWPSVAATYAVSASQAGPAIELQLTFDSTVYQGLIGAQVTSGTTIDAKFTEALDQTSAENLLNYSLDHEIKLVSAKLGGDGSTVTLTVDKIPEPVEISLTIANIRNAAEPLSSESQTFQGVATFFSPVSAGLPTSTLLQKALGDLNTYTQLWYQLNDPYGIGYRVLTSLTIHDYTLDAAQVSELVGTWLASIWRFVNDRSQGGTTVAKPRARLPFTFSVAESSLNPDEIYSLELGFTIERTGGAIIGDLETTGGITSVTSAVSPYAGAAGELATDLTAFARNFEAALSRTGEYQLRVATSVDRKASLSGNSGNELWVVRLGLNPQRSISYQIDHENGPLLFAPKPISTKLENRTQVPIWDFNPVTGIDFNAQPSRFLDFTGIDMDLWGRQFFGDIDNVLSPEFTAAIQLVDNHQHTTYLETILENKKRLADIVKNWMDFVFVGESGSTTEIQEAFRQQVLVRLSNAYTVKAGVQYTARVQAGAFRLLFAGVGSDNTDSLMLLFTSDIQATVAQDKNNYSVSGGLTVNSATLDSLNPQIVTLKLSGPPQVGETVVTISNSYQDARGAHIVPPLNVLISSGTAATPEIYGNIAQNFKFAGATLDHADNTRVFLFFSGALDKATAETTSKYQVSDLTVVSAVLDAASQGVVTLTLSGDAVVDVTTVTVLEPFANAVGQELLPPFKQTVTSSVDVAHRTQGISLTAAKVNLKNSDAVPLPFLVSGPELIRTQSGAIISYIDLDTTYQASSIEHQIGTLPNVADYRASTWLSFLSDPKPLRADLGRTQVPMLLRSFPAAPSMVSQEGKSSYVIVPNDLEKILNWDYSINYSQIVHYPQDELYFTVNFNVQDSPNRMETIEDAFDELAEFITVYPDQVEPVLRNTLMKIDAQTTDPAEFASAAIALSSVNAMVGRVIAAAAGNSLIMAPTGRVRTSNVAEPYLFSLREGSGTVADDPDVLVITIVGTPPAGIDNPSVEIPGYTTQTYPGTCHGDFCFYFEDGDGKPLSAAIGQGIGPRTVILPKMNILQRQDAETTVELKRNMDLVPDKHTAPEFIYTTGNVGFANPLFPLIEYDQELPVESVGPGGSRTGTLQQLLTEFFEVLLAQNTQDSLSFLMTCTYTYQANAMLEPTLIPVMMQPKQSIDVTQPQSGSGETTLAEMIGAWSGSILKWFSDHQTSTQAGILHFDLTIFTNLTEQSMPMLRLNKMVLALKYVTDLPS